MSVVLDEICLPNSAASIFSASAMPTAGGGWPSGPVVVSTPLVKKFSGVSRVSKSTCREALDLVQRHLAVAGEVEQHISSIEPWPDKKKNQWRSSKAGQQHRISGIS